MSKSTIVKAYLDYKGKPHLTESAAKVESVRQILGEYRSGGYSVGLGYGPSYIMIAEDLPNFISKLQGLLDE